MFYLSKIAQAAGLAVILWGFATSFPNVMSRQALAIGILLFVFGWIVQNFLLKK